MTHAWVLVANGSRARLFEAARGVRLEERAAWVHDASRWPARDLKDSRSGRRRDGVSVHRSAMNEAGNAHDREPHRFAEELAEDLQQRLAATPELALHVIAPPNLLGALREALPPRLLAAVRSETTKDYVTQDAGRLGETLRDELVRL